MLRFGGTQSPRSGAGPLKKNDGRTTRTLGNELIEFKRTDNKKSITLQAVDLLALEVHAISESRDPILGFDLAGRHYVVMPEEVHLERRARSTASQRCCLGRDGCDHAPGLGTDTGLLQASEVRRHGDDVQEPFLRRVSGQPRGGSGQGDLPRNRIRGGRRVSGQVRVPEVRRVQAGAERSVGRGIRARKTQDTPGDRTDPQ